MEKTHLSHEKRVNIEDIPADKTVEDYPEDTVFVWKNNEPTDNDSDWEE